MASEKITQILEEVKALTILELADLVKALEEEFGVSAAPVAVAGAAVAAAAEDAGTEYMLVEQDDCHGEDPFSAMKRSYEYLRAMGLE